jgi:hypothetical protein
MEDAMKAMGKAVVCFCFLCASLWPGRAGAQSIAVDEVVGLYRSDTVKTGTPIIFKLRYISTDVISLMISNGYEIYSPDGADWTHSSVKGDTLTGAIPRSNWDISFAMNVFLGAGIPPRDTVGILGARISALGLPPGFNGVPYGIAIGSLPDTDDGKTICIDSAWFRPGGVWKWAGSGGVNRFPSWGGPYCYHIYMIPDIKPTITNAPASITGLHCRTMTFTFRGSDPEGETVTYEKVSGPGTINATTGAWSYLPSVADIGQAITLVVRACEVHGCGVTSSVNLIVTNSVPALTTGCRDTAFVTPGNSKTKTVRATDGCSDPLHYVLASVTPPLDGNVTINATTGVITFSTNAGAVLGLYDLLVYASDTRDSVSCHTYFRVTKSCCVNNRGDWDGNMVLDISDMVHILDFLFFNGPKNACAEVNNVDGSPDGVVDISDLTYFIDYVFRGGPSPPPCN